MNQYNQEMEAHNRSREFWTRPALGAPPDLSEMQKDRWEMHCDRGQRAVREIHIILREWEHKTVIQGFVFHLENGTVHR